MVPLITYYLIILKVKKYLKYLTTWNLFDTILISTIHSISIHSGVHFQPLLYIVMNYRLLIICLHTHTHARSHTHFRNVKSTKWRLQKLCYPETPKTSWWSPTTWWSITRGLLTKLPNFISAISMLRPVRPVKVSWWLVGSNGCGLWMWV